MVKVNGDGIISLSYYRNGVFQGGSFYLLGIQVAGLVAIASWTLVWAYIVLKLIEKTIGLRVSLHEELVGADLIEHTIGEVTYDKKTKTFNCSKAKQTEESGSSANGSTTTGPNQYRAYSMTGFNSATRRKHAYVNSEIYRLVCEFEQEGRANKKLGSHTYPKGSKKRELMLELPGRASGLRRHHSNRVGSNPAKPQARRNSRWRAAPDSRKWSAGRRFADLFSNSGCDAQRPGVGETKDGNGERKADDSGGGRDYLAPIILQIEDGPKRNGVGDDFTKV